MNISRSRSAVNLVAAVTIALGNVAPAYAESLDIDSASIADLNHAYATGKLTSEKVVAAYLKRIEAYDKHGPTINAVITLNPNALKTAKALDAERKKGKVRGPLHGIPIVLKDNFDTFDLPTTAGSQLLEGSIPPDDAFVVKRLRDAGAIILAKVNMSEWAGGAGVYGTTDPELAKKGAVPNGFSSAGGQTRNPHDLSRGPAGSSGGTGAAIAAAFAQLGMGTDTGGSVRGPSSVNGLVGLKPTNGLLSRDGIVPLSLTFDTGGPMARNVYDLAVALGTMTGVDSADALTQTSAGKFETDYTRFLKPGALQGARIGIARDFMGRNEETDRITEAAIATLKKLGAEVVDDVRYPKYLLDVRQSLLTTVMNADFKVQIGDYLATTGPKYPKSYADVVARSNDPATHYRSPEKAWGLQYNASVTIDQTDPVYVAAKEHGLPLIKSAMLAVFENYKLDAIVYPTSPEPASLINPPEGQRTAGGGSATGFANLTGFPDLIVPAGMTSDGLPVTISFFGPAYTEAKLLGYGYDFEQATKARVLPKNTPPLPSDQLKY
ncbi:MAG TPA: amidase family protein [Steroidobacter sp.]